MTVALEPEAASIYCQYLKFAKGKRYTSSPTLGVLKPGTKYMVVDLGGKLYARKILNLFIICLKFNMFSNLKSS